MSGEKDIYGVNTLPFVIAPGETNAILIEPRAGQCATLLKYFSGNSVMIIGCTVGSTLTGAELVSAGNSLGYVMGTSEVVMMDGGARFYLMAIGATATVMSIRGLSQGF